jgi:hypothetical protein
MREAQAREEADESDPPAPVPVANPLNSHGAARKLTKAAWAWGATVTAWGLYLVLWHRVWWEMLVTAACLWITVRCIDVLRRL